MKVKPRAKQWDCRQAEATDCDAIIACWYGVEYGSDEHQALSEQLTSDADRLHNCWLAERDYQVEAVVWLAVQPPGYAHCWPLRSVFESTTPSHRECAQALWQEVGAHYQQQGVNCIQALIPTVAKIDIGTLTELRFQKIASILRLEYLPEHGSQYSSEGLIQLVAVTEGNQHEFEACLHDTFVDSLDVPEMNQLDNGVREGLHYREPSLQRFLLMQQDYGVVGVAVLDTSKDEGLLRYVGLASSYRQQGYGKQALALLIERMRSAGCIRIEVRVDARNLPALGLYTGYGFVQVDEEIMLIYPPLAVSA